MADDAETLDLALGVPLAAFAKQSLLAGRFGEHGIVLARTEVGVFALDAQCTHSGAPLAKGLLVGETIRCPWHHACFDARTGTAIAAPALKALGRWEVEERDGIVRVIGRHGTVPTPASVTRAHERIVIIGAGAGGAAAAAALVALGHGASVTLVGHEDVGPYDRTMLTKHYLSGQARDDELPLATDDLRAAGVDLRLGSTVARIEPARRMVQLTNGAELPYTTLIMATGAEPKRLTVPGAELPHVRVLRSAEDARSIIAAPAARVVVIGGSFIGLEAAASLRDRDLDVAVVSPDPTPFAKTLGPALAEAVLDIHRAHGTRLHLGREVVRIEPDAVHLDDGTALPADLVVVGVGVSPRTALAEQAGLAVEDGVIVDDHLRTSDPDIYAVGDIARWPDPHSGGKVRVEHWAVAQRQGQVAAMNVVGLDRRYDVVPFFWTLHFDLSVRMVGHAAGWDAATVEGDPSRKDAVVRFSGGGRDLAVATVERDREALEAELAMERRLGGLAAALPASDTTPGLEVVR